LYREALDHLERDTIRADDLVTHRYDRLEDLDRALGIDPGSSDYLKGVLIRDVR
jgi:hypothetical protein